MEVSFDECTLFKASALVTGGNFVPNQERFFSSESHKRRFEKSVGITGHFEQEDGSIINLGLRATKLLKKENPEVFGEVATFILMTQTSTTALPSNSVIIQGLAGMNEETYCIDLNQGCSGFNYGYDLALHRARSTNRPVLVVHADCYQSRIKSDANTKLLFSDVGFAYLVEPNINRKIKLVDQYFWNSGLRAETMYSSQDHWLENHFDMTADGSIRMNGAEIYNFAIGSVAEKLKMVLARNNLGTSDLKRVYLHQANRQLLQTLTISCGLSSDVVPINVDRYANSVSASIPILIAEDSMRFAGGDLFMIVGFGVGLSISISIYQKKGE